MKEARIAAKEAESLALHYAKGMHRTQKNISQNIFASTPNEILLEVFRYLGSRDLYTISSVCRRWKALVKNNPTLWLHQVELKGTFRSIAKQWTYVQKRQLSNNGPISLDLRHDELKTFLIEDEDPRYEDDWDLYHTECEHWFVRKFSAIFPFQDLLHLRYKGTCNMTDHHLWRALKDCQKLKTLIFASSAEEDDGGYGWEGDLESLPNDSAIMQCQLEHLELDSEIEVDLSGLQMYSLRILKVMTTMGVDAVHRCIQSASSTLQELHLSAFRQDYYEDCQDRSCMHNDTTLRRIY